MKKRMMCIWLVLLFCMVVGCGQKKESKEAELSASKEEFCYAHWLMELLVKSKASTFRGDYYSHGKQFIATLPIYKINFEDPNEVAKHQRIVDLVQTIMSLKEQLSTAPNIAQRTVLERSITAVNTELNSVIDELYQVESQDNEE